MGARGESWSLREDRTVQRGGVRVDDSLFSCKRRRFFRLDCSPYGSAWRGLQGQGDIEELFILLRLQRPIHDYFADPGDVSEWRGILEAGDNASNPMGADRVSGALCENRAVP